MLFKKVFAVSFSIKMSNPLEIQRKFLLKTRPLEAI